jgi:hypothetical protein
VSGVLKLGSTTFGTENNGKIELTNVANTSFSSSHHTWELKAVDAPIVGANYSTNDDPLSGQLAIYNGATKLWGINESGGVFSPNNPGCYCRGYAGSNTLTSTTIYGAYNIWYYDEVKHNIGNHFNNSTGYFTAPYSGRYLISGNSGYKAAVAYLGFGIIYNGITPLFINWSSENTNLDHAYNGGTLIHEMSAGDFIGIGNFDSSSYTVPHSEVYYVAFSVYFLG